MKDELKKYVEKRIGISVSDEFYYHCISQLSSELTRSEIAKELTEYFNNHNSKALSSEAYDYVQNRTKIFKENLSNAGFMNSQSITYNNVKEISIVSKHEDYEDLLRMSSHWISYKKQFANKEESWSYKTQSNDYYGKYERMVETFEHLRKCPPEFEYNENDYKVSIRVTFMDDSYITFYRTSSFGNNSMYQQAVAIIDMIPKEERIPVFLKPFKETILNKEMVEGFNNENIVGIFYGGDMGRIGSLDIVTNDFKLISSDNNHGEYDVYKFASKFAAYKELLDSDFIDVKRFRIDGECWYPLYLGAGNRVFLNDRLYRDLINYLFNNKAQISYGKWNDLVLN